MVARHWHHFFGAFYELCEVDCQNAFYADTFVLFPTHNNRMRGSIHAAGQKRTCENDDSDCVENMLFDRLCPLLIIKMLPLRVFDDFNCMAMYGQTLKQCVANGKFLCFSFLDKMKSFIRVY